MAQQKSNNNNKTKGKKTKSDKELLEKTAENRAKGQSKTEAMKNVGYSETNVDRNSGRTHKSKTFQELLKEKLPDEDVLDSHRGLMFGRKLETQRYLPGSVSDEELQQMFEEVNCIVRMISNETDNEGKVQHKHVFYWAPDNNAREKAIKMAYDVKGYSQADTIQINDNPYHSLSDADLAERQKKLKNQLKKRE